MRVRLVTTIIFAAAVAIIAPLAGATVASAVPPGQVTDNGNGTATVVYPNIGLTRGVLLCDPSFVATSLTQCNVNTYAYVLSSEVSNLPASPFVISAGMPVYNFAGDPTTLPVGHYTLVSLYGTVGPAYTWLAGSQNVYIGSVAASNPIPDWLQAVGRESAIATCPFGWNPSWHEWPNGHTGGFVCVRVIPSLG